MKFLPCDVDMVIHSPLSQLFRQSVDIGVHPLNKGNIVILLPHGCGSQGSSRFVLVCLQYVDHVYSVAGNLAADKVCKTGPCFCFPHLLQLILHVLQDSGDKTPKFCGRLESYIKLILENGNVPLIGGSAVKVSL